MSTKPKKKLRKRTIFTILAMFNITWYTIVVLVASFLDHAVQSDLTIAWFTAWTAELALLYGIRVHDKYTGEDTCKDPDEEADEKEEESTNDSEDESFPEAQSEDFNETSDES